MKPFIPFLMVPVVGLAGWSLSALHSQPQLPELPSIPSLEAPPALGVTATASKDRSSVKVSMDALLPPIERQHSPLLPGPQPIVQPHVDAILINGAARAALVDGKALTVGEGLGDFKIAVIETDRVLFENISLSRKSWVSVSKP